jgi:hypothetical protein
VRGYRRIPFAQKCPETGVIVSGNIHYNLQKNKNAEERWMKTGFECDRQKDCGVTPSECPVFLDSPAFL